MNREYEKKARIEAGHGPVVVDLRGRVPAMDDKALAALHANALRLKEAGTTAQRASAVELLPVVESELAERKAKKRPAAAVAASTTKKKAKRA